MCILFLALGLVVLSLDFNFVSHPSFCLTCFKRASHSVWSAGVFSFITCSSYFHRCRHSCTNPVCGSGGSSKCLVDAIREFITFY